MPAEAVVRGGDAASRHELQQDALRFAKERLTPAEAKAALLGAALEVVSADPGELPAETPAPKTAAQHVREAAAEELTRERPAASGGDLDAQLEARREIFEIAGRDLAPNRGRVELERQLNAYERQRETQEPEAVEEPAAGRAEEPGKDWSSLYAGMSSEELDAAQDALIDAQVEAETAHLSPADFAFEPGVETAVIDEDDDDYSELDDDFPQPPELDSLPGWAPGGHDYEGDETE